MTDAPASALSTDRLTAEVSGNRFELLFDGAERLRRLRALIDGAAHSIDIIMYLFDDDAAGREVVARLLAAAERGVRVRAGIDRFGSARPPDRKSGVSGTSVSVRVALSGRRTLKHKPDLPLSYHN